MGKWILAFLIAAAVLFLCWKLRGVMLTPVCRGKGQSLELILRVSGASPELEATVDGLLWLINDGVLFGRIVLLDDGMDEETREIARRLSLGQGNVTLCSLIFSSLVQAVGISGILLIKFHAFSFVMHNLNLESEFETGTYIFSFLSSIGFIR